MLYAWPGGGELAARARKRTSGRALLRGTRKKWEPGGELARVSRLSSVGGALLGLAPGALLVQPLAELFTELLDGLALVSEYQEPEPFGLLGLLDKQFACVRRGHVHLPFLVAVVGGSLGGGRWAVRLARMIAAFFCAVNTPKSLPWSSFRGDRGTIFAQKSVAIFRQNATDGGL